MTTTLSPFEENTLPSPQTKKRSPARSLSFLAGMIFMAEMVSMVVLYFLEIPNYIVNSILDGIMMLALILPGLYIFQLKPLLAEIEERKAIENALRTSDGQLKNILELLPVGVWIIDKDGNIIHGNPASQTIWAGARYVGIDQYGEYRGWRPDSGARIQAHEWAAAKAIDQGIASLNEEVEIENFAGEHKVILNSAVPILEDGSTVRGAIVVNQDITHRRLAEKERIRNSELLDRFFSSIGTLIAYMDRDFNFIRVNDSYAATAGHPQEFIIGKNHFDLYPNEENRDIFQKVVETGEPFAVLAKPFEYAEYPERGVTYWDWRLEPVKDREGRIEGLVLSLLDVTEKKRAVIELEQKNEELVKAYEAETSARQVAETLGEAAQALTRTLDLDQVFNTLLDYIHPIVHSDVANVIMLEDETNLAVRAVRGYGRWANRTDIPTLHLNGMTDSILRRLTTDRRCLTFPDPGASGDRTGMPDVEAIRNWLAAPIVIGDQVIGVLEFGTVGSEPYTPEQVQWAEALVGQAAVAIQNAWLFEQVRASSERLQSLARKLVEIQENERFHIARELHDEAGQSLSSMKLSLGKLEQDPECTERVRERLAELKDSADGVLEELHRLALDLRPAALDRLGLVAALEQYANNLSSESLLVQFKAIGFDGDRLAPEVETSLYRIVQEAGTNVVRHARASTLGILLERSDGRVRIFVEDDGAGFSPGLFPEEDRLGLVGMRERSEMLGGTLTIESAPGKGTSIIVEVPDVHSDPHRG
jgi:PAS domain S-box-containing protein